ncbi:hypothetical protein JWZ97_18685 [Methylococcus sp. EFPC2]|nr:hypothetical protein JWZ97_18685 [Methylococcus sp. EFPC2]
MKCGLLAVSLAASGLMLTGCGGDGTGGSSVSAKIEAKIGGTVSDNKGPVHTGRIEVTDKNGAPLTSVDFEGGRYSVTVPAGATYPIVITAHPSPDSPSTDPVKAAVTSAIADRQDISPVTTYVVDNALAIGGLTPENIAKASGGAIGMRQSQGVSAGAGGSAGGPGNSGGGTGKGGHAGHDMTDKSSGSHDTNKAGGEAEQK